MAKANSKPAEPASTPESEAPSTLQAEAEQAATPTPLDEARDAAKAAYMERDPQYADGKGPWRFKRNPSASVFEDACVVDGVTFTRGGPPVEIEDGALAQGIAEARDEHGRHYVVKA